MAIKFIKQERSREKFYECLLILSCKYTNLSFIKFIKKEIANAKNKLYHRILAVVLTVAMTMTSLSIAVTTEMTNDVNAATSSGQINDIPNEAMSGSEASNNSGEETSSSEADTSSEDTDAFLQENETSKATQSEASLRNESQEPEQSKESVTSPLGAYRTNKRNLNRHSLK